MPPLQAGHAQEQPAAVWVVAAAAGSLHAELCTQFLKTLFEGELLQLVHCVRRSITRPDSEQTHAHA